MKHPFNTVRLKPLIGPMNPVASADEIPPGVFSWKENLEISKTNRLARRAGWQEFLRGTGAGDDGAPLANVRHLDEVVTTDGVRRLVAATSGGEVYLLGSASLDWTKFTGEFGQRNEWTSDALGNVLVISNGEGLVRYAVLPTSNFLDPIDELDSSYTEGPTIGASAVKVIVQFSGVMFIMNYSEGGVPIPWRVRWSALNVPTSYVDSVSTIAAFQDLPWTQKIINAKVLENRMLIYTDTSIWQCRATGGDGVFNFTELYTDPDARSRCLAYRQSLVAVGSSHIYAGQDGIYSFSNYQRQPERLRWLDDAARLMFEPGTDYTLDRSVCDLVAGFNSDKQEVWFSWTGKGGKYTLVADTIHKTCDIIRKGWHAFIQQARSSDQSFGDWLDQYVTNDSELWFEITNPSYTELCSKNTNDFCAGCNDSQLFIGALKEDEAIKTIGVDASGERIPGHSTGGYVEGFKSVLRGVVPVGNEDHDKVLRKVKVEIYSRVTQGSNVRLQLRTGLSNQAFNPNDDDRELDGITWTTHPLRAVGPDPDKTSGKTMDDLAAVNKLRVIPVEWNAYARAPFVYWELSVVDRDGNGTVVTGDPGALEFSRVEFEVQGLPRR